MIVSVISRVVLSTGAVLYTHVYEDIQSHVILIVWFVFDPYFSDLFGDFSQIYRVLLSHS